MFQQLSAEVIANEWLSPRIARIRIEVPRIACTIRPGQFVMVRPTGRTAPLLGRPLALYDVVARGIGEADAIDLVYLVQGAGTKALSELMPGQTVETWGPLGNTFPRPSADLALDHLLIVAGGIGQTPFPAVINDLLGLKTYGSLPEAVPRPRRITFAWGAQNAESLVAVSDFEDLVDVLLATDDGSIGFKGTSVDLARTVVDSDDSPTAVFACGPERMLASLCELTREASLPTWVSLETGMACGYGVCFSCVCPIVDDSRREGWDYKRVCLEGPIFRAEDICWSQMLHA